MINADGTANGTVDAAGGIAKITTTEQLAACMQAQGLYFHILPSHRYALQAEDPARNNTAGPWVQERLDKEDVRDPKKYSGI